MRRVVHFIGDKLTEGSSKRIQDILNTGSNKDAIDAVKTNVQAVKTDVQAVKTEVSIMKEMLQQLIDQSNKWKKIPKT